MDDVESGDRWALAHIPIHYDGLDATRHELELGSLGESLQGVSKILGVVGHFVSTLQYAKQQQALSVRVIARPPTEGSFDVGLVIEFVRQHQILSGSANAISTILKWIFARNSGQKEEMQALKESLNRSLELLAGQNQPVVDRLATTVERLADALRPSMVSAVAPVGKSCRVLRFGNQGPVVDEATADAIRAESADEVTDAREWSILITELDVENGTAKVRLTGEGEDSKRFRARISDPAFDLVGNLYATALLNASALRVIAKATLRDGEIQMLYISDAVAPRQPA